MAGVAFDDLRAQCLRLPMSIPKCTSSASLGPASQSASHTFLERPRTPRTSAAARMARRWICAARRARVATAGVEKAGTRSDGGVSSRTAPPPPLRQLSSIQKLEAELRHVSERTEELQIREMAHDGAAAAPPAPAASAPTASPTAASASAVSKAAAPPSWAAIAAKNRIRADLKQLAARHRQLKMELAAELGADDDGGASSSCPPPLVTRATSLAPPHPRCASSQSPRWLPSRHRRRPPPRRHEQCRAGPASRGAISRACCKAPPTG